MKRVVFINLLIDRFWSKGSLLEKLFSVSNPESLRLSLISYNLGLNFRDQNSSESDIYVCVLKPDEYWLTHFKKLHQVDSFRVKEVGGDPFKTLEWLDNYKKNKDLIGLAKFVFSSYSSLEASLEELCGIKTSRKTIENNIYLNDKTTLVNWVKSQNISFPETDIVSGEKISFVEADDSFVYKFHLSSGGGGKFSLAQLKSFYPWIQSRGLEEDWKKSLWLKQEKILVSKEFSIFSHTEQNDYELAVVEYDSGSLSYLHFFGTEKESSEAKHIQEAFVKIKKFLNQNSYQGFFGFDALKSEDGRFFPVVDLNVRVTKTHLLAMGLKKWQPSHVIKAFYRKRFRKTNSKENFQAFWEAFCHHLSLNIYGEREGKQIYPFDVSGFSEGKAEITFLISMETEEKIRAELVQIDLVMKKMGYE